MAEWSSQFGHGRQPIFATNSEGVQFLAVGDEVFWAESLGTPAEFFSGYVGLQLGKEWGENELNKPLAERHILLRWFDKLQKLVESTTEVKDGHKVFPLSGEAGAYILLGYQLYTLRHNQAFQRVAVEKLKHPREFQGAYYEIFVAAALVRAGFEIAYEDEGDSSRRHPELVARHKVTGQKIAVEAKSRRWPGVMCEHGERSYSLDRKLNVARLLRDALDKPSNVSTSVEK